MKNEETIACTPDEVKTPQDMLEYLFTINNMDENMRQAFLETIDKLHADPQRSLPTDEEMKVMALEKVPVEMENERSQAGQYDCKKWDRELYFEGLKDMRSLLRTNFSSEKCEGEGSVVSGLKNSDWRLCEKATPEDYQEVLIYACTKQGLEVLTAMYCDDTDSNYIIHNWNKKTQGNIKDCEIIYWKPNVLPNPPKQEQQTTK